MNSDTDWDALLNGTEPEIVWKKFKGKLFNFSISQTNLSENALLRQMVKIHGLTQGVMMHGARK
jgi:hypothetical protein